MPYVNTRWSKIAAHSYWEFIPVSKIDCQFGFSPACDWSSCILCLLSILESNIIYGFVYPPVCIFFTCISLICEYLQFCFIWLPFY
jgi:hypothetical protein